MMRGAQGTWSFMEDTTMGEFLPTRSLQSQKNNFSKLHRTVELLRATGASEAVITALLEEKFQCDLAHERARREQPSSN